jgi:hypothetical protein
MTSSGDEVKHILSDRSGGPVKNPAMSRGFLDVDEPLGSVVRFRSMRRKNPSTTEDALIAGGVLAAIAMAVGYALYSRAQTNAQAQTQTSSPSADIVPPFVPGF